MTPGIIDTIVNHSGRTYNVWYKLEARTNFNYTGSTIDDWVEVPFINFRFNQSMDSVVSNLKLTLTWDKDRLDETDMTQVIKMFTEIRLTQYLSSNLDHGTGAPVSEDVVLFHGFIYGPTTNDIQYDVVAYDPL